MKYLDERVIFNFPAQTTSGVRKYEVYVDTELAFVGNTYVIANEPIDIDITDICANYVVSDKPYNTTSEKDLDIRNFSIKIYNADNTLNTEEDDDVFLIYRYPFYKSYVTTPVLDYTETTYGYQPLLQGWNKDTYKGEFIPTYPKVPSTNFTFDYVGLLTNVPYINVYNIVYKDGTSTGVNSITVNLNGVGGAYKYSIPLSEFIITNETTKEYYDNADTYLSFRSSGWTTTNPTFETENGDVRQLTLRNTSFTGSIDNVDIYYNDTTVAADLDTGTDVPNTSVWDKTITLNKSEIPQRVHILLKNAGQEEVGQEVVGISIGISNLPDNLNTLTLEFSIMFNDTLNLVAITIRTKIKTTDILGICDTDKIQLTTFSPMNTNIRSTVDIANLDGDSRFFLKWKDRYGMPQCQPFAGTELYSENVNRDEITTLKNNRKIISANVQPKWKLNTKWINQKYYPFYESIFVSPYLQLYDTHEDKIYDVVLVNTNYEEKTFYNQNRQMFNLQLEVELSSTQKMIF